MPYQFLDPIKYWETAKSYYDQLLKDIGDTYALSRYGARLAGGEYGSGVVAQLLENIARQQTEQKSRVGALAGKTMADLMEAARQERNVYEELERQKREEQRRRKIEMLTKLGMAAASAALGAIYPPAGVPAAAAALGGLLTGLGGQVNLPQPQGVTPEQVAKMYEEIYRRFIEEGKEKGGKIGQEAKTKTKIVSDLISRIMATEPWSLRIYERPWWAIPQSQRQWRERLQLQKGR